MNECNRLYDSKLQLILQVARVAWEKEEGRRGWDDWVFIYSHAGGQHQRQPISATQKALEEGGIKPCRESDR